MFDKTLPIEGAKAPTYNNIMRADKTALEAALNAWMYFATGGTQTGQPRQGQARPYFQDAAPTTRLDGDHFDSTDLGCLWIDSNSSPANQVNFLSTADGAGTNTWTPISTEIIAVLLAANRIFAGTLKSTGNFTVGANKMTVAAATGNAVIAGTLGVTGVTTVAKGSLLASSDAPTTDVMIPPKKYVDDAIGQSSQVVGTDTITNTSGNWADMANMSITIVTKGGNVLLLFSATINCDAGSSDYALRFDVDGTPHQTLVVVNNGDIRDVSFHWLETSLGAASHTFKVQWKDTTGTVEQRGDTEGPRAFSAIELPS